jgi:hypothetical protein
MAFLKNLFGGKKDFTSVLTQTRDDFFRLYGVSTPTNAQNLTALFYICESGIALLNYFDQETGGGGFLNRSIERLIDAAADLASRAEGVMRIADLTKDRDQLKRLVDYFQASGIDVDATCHIDGVLAFDGLYNTIGEELVKRMLGTKGPGGIVGYASILASDNVLGEDALPRGRPDADMQLFNKFSGDLVEVIRVSGGK